MATNSIMKSVVIRNSSAAKRLVNALENAEGKKIKKETFSKKRQDIRGDKILDFFGDNK